MVTVRDFREGDAPVLWTLSTMPYLGRSADPGAALALPAAAALPEGAFADLADVPGQAEALRVRVHPATRRETRPEWSWTLVYYRKTLAGY